MISSTSAPASICSSARRSAPASSPFCISSISQGLPVGLMRSPIRAKGAFSPMRTSFDRLVRQIPSCFRLFFSTAPSFLTLAASMAMCSGVVPQQPPSTCVPICANRAVFLANSSGPWGKMVFPFSSLGKPAFGSASTGQAQTSSSLSTTGCISSGPRLQLVPITSTPRFCMVSANISGIEPVRLVPFSKVMEIMSGRELVLRQPPWPLLQQDQTGFP